MRVSDELDERLNEQMLVVGGLIIFYFLILNLQVEDKLSLDLLTILRLPLIMVTRLTRKL